MPKRPTQRRFADLEASGPTPDDTDDILAIILDRYYAVEENAENGGELFARITPEKLESLLGTAGPTERLIFATGRRLIRTGERALIADIARELGIDPATARQSVGRLARRVRRRDLPAKPSPLRDDGRGRTLSHAKAAIARAIAESEEGSS